MSKLKKALLALLTCSVAVTGAFAFAACNNNSNNSNTGNENIGGDDNTPGGDDNTPGGDDNTPGGDDNTPGGDDTETTTHTHVWSEWIIDQEDLLNYNGVAVRECTGKGECDADESLLQVTVPSVRNSEDYTYEDPVHKKEATCIEHGIDTYTYTDPDSKVSVTFDVETPLGDHNFENGECTVCHMSVANVQLGANATVSVTAELGAVLSFTAETAGRYEIAYADGSATDATISLNGLPTGLPYTTNLAEGQTISFMISGTEEATYEFKATSVAVLQHDYSVDEDLDPTVTPATATVHVGGGISARLDVSGRGYGVISYNGATPVTVSYSVYVLGQGYKNFEYTLSTYSGPGTDGDSFTVDFSLTSIINITVTSAAAEEAFDAEFSLLLSDGNSDEVEAEVINLGEDVTVSDLGDSDFVRFAINLPAGSYRIMDNGKAVDLSDYWANELIGILDDNGELETLETDADDVTVVTITSGGVYYIDVYAETTFKVVTADGTEVDPTADLTDPARGTEINLNQNINITRVSGEYNLYKITLAAGDYQVLIDGRPVTISGMFDDLCLSSTNPDDEIDYISDEDKVIKIETAGTYYVMVYEAVSFKFVEATDETGGEEESSTIDFTVGSVIEGTVNSTGSAVVFGSDFVVGKTYTFNIMMGGSSTMIVDASGSMISEFTYTEDLQLTVKTITGSEKVMIFVSVKE